MISCKRDCTYAIDGECTRVTIVITDEGCLLYKEAKVEEPKNGEQGQ
jgi:hypothetical protein